MDTYTFDSGKLGKNLTFGIKKTHSNIFCNDEIAAWVFISRA